MNFDFITLAQGMKSRNDHSHAVVTQFSGIRVDNHFKRLNRIDL